MSSSSIRSMLLVTLLYTFLVVTSYAESDLHSFHLAQKEELTLRKRMNRDVSDECNEPTQDDLLQLLEPANVLNSLVEVDSEENTRSRLFATLDRISESTTSSCTVEDLQSSSHLLGETLNLRTTCPWDVIVNVNNTRYPREIPFAVCKCSNCVSSSSSSFFSMSASCQPVIEMMPVLVRGECENNQASYTLHEEPVSVGCICERDSEVI